MGGASFKGNLEILNLSDIFQSLAMNRHSGTLVINDGKREKKIYFADGEIQLLSSSRRTKLGELLISTGKISEDDLDLALKLQKQNRKKLGEILVEEGFCDEEDIARIVKFQIEEEIYDLFLWRRAEFEFIADHMPEEMKKGSTNLMRLQLNTNSLIMEALRRLDEWELVKQAVPSTKEIFVVIDQRKLDGIELPERLRNEIHLIDGKTNVEGLAEKTLISEFELCKLLADLVHQGAIQALPMQELVQKAEEAYAVNDFAAAAALYGRLSELAPGEPKVLIPLADSLRRSGDDRAALVIFDEIARKLDPSRDHERLRRVYETIVALDPDRADLVKKLEEFDKRAVAKRRSGFALPLGIILVALVGAGIWLVRGPLAAILAQKQDEKEKLHKETERVADDLLQKSVSARNVEKNYEACFKYGVKIWKDYSTTRAYDKVELPILVRTEPPGYTILVNQLAQGVTSQQDPVVVGTYRPPVNRVLVEVRRFVPGAKEKDLPILDQRVIEKPQEWQGEIVFQLEAKAERSFPADAPIDAELAYQPGAKTWLAIGRDGVVYEIDENMERVQGWNSPSDPKTPLSIGDMGDVFSPATIVGDRAYVGATTGGVAVLDLPKKAAILGLFPVDQGAVRGRPIVLARSQRVVFATTTGTIYGYPIEGTQGSRASVWTHETDGSINFPGILRDDDSDVVVFASDDERLRAIDAKTGKDVWPKPPVVGVAVAPLVRSKDAILVANAEGELVQVSKDGKVLDQRYVDPKHRRFRFVRDDAGDRLFLVTEDGRVRALDARTFEPLWKPAGAKDPVDFVRRKDGADVPTTRFPSIVYVAAPANASPPVPDRVFCCFDDARVLGIDAKTGQLAWQGNMERGQGASAITVAGSSVVVAPAGYALLRLFKP